MRQNFDRSNALLDKFELQTKSVGALQNKSFAAKDLFDIEGRITGAGNPRWFEAHSPATKNALAVDSLLNAGAMCFGKSVTDEFAFSLDGLNYHFPIPQNGQFPDRIPGGSSSGSASSVSTNLVDFALGTDTVGSVRVPSAYCGIWGFRPTHGVVPLDGVHPLGPSFDTVGWMSKQPELMLIVGKTLLESDEIEEKEFSPLISKSLFDLINTDYSDQLFDFAKEILKDSSNIDDIAFDTKLLDIWALTFAIIRSYEAWNFYKDWLKKESSSVSPVILSRLKEGEDLSSEQNDYALSVKETASSYLNQLLSQNKVLCLPTTCNLPPLLDATKEELSQNRIQNIRLTIISVIAGLPQVCFPVFLNSGVCLSLSLIGPTNSDLSLINYAIKLKAALQK